MRHLASVLSLSLLLTTLGARADLAVGPFSAVMTSPAMPSRRALIVTPAFLDDRVNARAAPARSDAFAYRDLLRLFGYSGTIVAADTRPALRVAVQDFSDTGNLVFPAGTTAPKPMNPAKSTRPSRSRQPAAALPSCISDEVVAIDPAPIVGKPPLHLGIQSYPQTLMLCDHEVVLTFDDGPSPETTPRILQALKKAGVHATFFLVGKRTREHPELAREEIAQGHTVGHHSNTHPSFTLRGFDTPSAETDIQNGIAEDEHAIYGDAATPDSPHVPFFRFPGFADTPELLSDLDRRGIAVFGSDLWAGDWIAMSADHERERVMALLAKRPRHNGIILFHDTRPSTAEMLPAFLAELKASGYRVVQVIYAKGAPRPPLTVPIEGEPETERIIAHLRPPIVPGSHRLPSKDERANDAGGEPPGEDPR